MRARLLVIVLVVVGLVAVGLGGLLAYTTAQAAQENFFTRRLTDTVYVASLVQRPLTEATGADLDALLDRYRQVYGVSVHVVTADGTPFAPSNPLDPLDAAGRERLDAALAGRRSQSPMLQMPWDERPLVIAEPVLVDGEVRGAVVTVSPTAALHERQLETWALIAAAVLLALALGVLVSLPVVRWILHPVRRLDEGTGRVASAVLAGGAAEPVADDSGPPELRRLSVSFDRMAETVTGALAAQRAFVADASHQLRNPLTALRLRLSNLQGHVDGAAADDHGAALEEAERLSTLLDELLALARTERTAPLADVDVDAAVSDRMEAWRPLAEHTGLRLERDGQPRPHGRGAGRGGRDRAGRRAGQRGEVLLAGRHDHGAHRAQRRPGGDRRARHGPGSGARRAGAGHGPLLAQPVAEQRRRVGAGSGDRCADRRAGRRIAPPRDPGGRWAAGGGAADGGRSGRHGGAGPLTDRSRHEVGQQPERAEQDRQHEHRRGDQVGDPALAGVEEDPAAYEQVEPDEVRPPCRSAERAAQEAGNPDERRRRHGREHVGQPLFPSIRGYCCAVDDVALVVDRDLHGLSALRAGAPPDPIVVLLHG